MFHAFSQFHEIWTFMGWQNTFCYEIFATATFENINFGLLLIQVVFPLEKDLKH
jgi:hypothetical protein